MNVWSSSRYHLALPSSSAVTFGPSSRSAWAHPCLTPMWALPRSLSVCHPLHPLQPALSAPWASQRPAAMCDNGDPDDKPPAPPVRMSSAIFSTGSGKDSLSANHSSKPLPSVPEERKRHKIIAIFSGAEKGGVKSLADNCFRLSSYSCVCDRSKCCLCHFNKGFGCFQVVERRIETKNDRRSPRLQILNTPYMLALTLSQGSSLWVSTVYSLSHVYFFFH